jgi:hypothetical protein
MGLVLIDIAEHDVVFEEYEDEIIFLQLKEGFYYTLDRMAADIFVALLRADSIETALGYLSQRYLTDHDELNRTCQKMINQLTEEKLIVERANTSSEHGELTSYTGKKQQLSEYHIEKFEDIQDILKFDPVHEVNEDGWPSVSGD